MQVDIPRPPLEANVDENDKKNQVMLGGAMGGGAGGGGAGGEEEMAFCILCIDEKPSSEGIYCRLAVAPHFTCSECFARWVLLCQQEKFKLRQHQGHIHCSAQDCKAEMWSSKEVRKGLRGHEEAYDVYVDALASLASPLEEPKNLGLKAQVGNTVNTALTLCCPNPRCGVALERRDGCNSMQCTSCGKFLCWLCFLSPSGSNSSESHAHVSDCAQNPQSGNLYADCTAAHKKRRIDNIRSALNVAFGNSWRSDVAVTTELRAMETQLRQDWNISIPEVLDIGPASVPLARANSGGGARERAAREQAVREQIRALDARERIVAQREAEREAARAREQNFPKSVETVFLAILVAAFLGVIYFLIWGGGDTILYWAFGLLGRILYWAFGLLGRILWWIIGVVFWIVAAPFRLFFYLFGWNGAFLIAFLLLGTLDARFHIVASLFAAYPILQYICIVIYFFLK